MSLLYLDSSALVKLVAREPETTALLALLEGRPEVVSSALARVEFLRVVARAGGGRKIRDRTRAVLSRVVLVALDDSVLEAAATLEPVNLRSLDAIHLATALSLRPDAEAIVGYDDRLNAAAEAAGFTVLTPG